MAIAGPKTKVKDLLKNEEASACLMKYMPQFDLSSPQVKMALPMTVKQLVSAPQSGVKLEDREALFAELEEKQFEV